MRLSLNKQILVECTSISGAILLEHIHFYSAKNNKAKYCHNDKQWTYDTIDKLAEKLYLSESKVRTATKKLLKADLILIGNFNLLKYDKTLWYTLTDKAIDIYQHYPIIISYDTEIANITGSLTAAVLFEHIRYYWLQNKGILWSTYNILAQNVGVSYKNARDGVECLEDKNLIQKIKDGNLTYFNLTERAINILSQGGGKYDYHLSCIKITQGIATYYAAGSVTSSDTDSDTGKSLSSAQFDTYSAQFDTSPDQFNTCGDQFDTCSDQINIPIPIENPSKENIKDKDELSNESRDTSVSLRTIQCLSFNQTLFDNFFNMFTTFFDTQNYGITKSSISSTYKKLLRTFTHKDIIDTLTAISSEKITKSPLGYLVKRLNNSIEPTEELNSLVNYYVRSTNDKEVSIIAMYKLLKKYGSEDIISKIDAMSNLTPNINNKFAYLCQSLQNDSFKESEEYLELKNFYFDTTGCVPSKIELCDLLKKYHILQIKEALVYATNINTMKNWRPARFVDAILKETPTLGIDDNINSDIEHTLEVCFENRNTPQNLKSSLLRNFTIENFQGLPEVNNMTTEQYQKFYSLRLKLSQIIVYKYWEINQKNKSKVKVEEKSTSEKITHLQNNFSNIPISEELSSYNDNQTETFDNQNNFNTPYHNSEQQEITFEPLDSSCNYNNNIKEESDYERAWHAVYGR